MIKLKDNRVLSPVTLDALQAEAIRAHLKHVHNGGSLLDPNMPREQKLAALVEEVGEVARCMTYDGDEGQDHFEKELIQVMCVAGTWLQSMHAHEVATLDD